MKPGQVFSEDSSLNYPASLSDNSQPQVNLDQVQVQVPEQAEGNFFGNIMGKFGQGLANLARQYTAQEDEAQGIPNEMPDDSRDLAHFAGETFRADGYHA